MANTFEKFPGHAYAPGMEPKFWDQIVTGNADATIGLISNTTLALVGLALVLYAVRVFGPGTRLKFTGNSAPLTSGGPALASGSGRAGNAALPLGGTVDGNLARALRHSRAQRADPEVCSTTAPVKGPRGNPSKTAPQGSVPQAAQPAGPTESGSS